MQVDRTSLGHAAPYHRLDLADGTLRFHGVEARELVAEYGTPLYVMDGNVIREQMALVKRFADGGLGRLFYAIKANPSLHLIRFFLSKGFGLDACSPGDVELGLKAGAKGGEISYTGVGLQTDEIQALVAHGIWVNLDSPVESKRWTECAAGRAVGLRVIPDIDAGFHPHCRSGMWGGKFGTPFEAVPDLARMLADHGCSVQVLHTHIGSSIETEEPYVQALDRLLDLATKMPDVRRIDLGGGMAARYHPEDLPFPFDRLYGRLEERLRRFRASVGRELAIDIEPGESLTSEAGCVLTRVLVTKQFSRNGRTVRLAIVDGGMNLIPAHSLYGSYLHLYVNGKEHPGAPRESVDVYGNTNQTGDSLALGRALPPLEEGDILAVRNAGAYSYCRSTRFNERPRPAEVWVEDGAHRVVRDAEGIDTLLQGQCDD